MQFFHNLLCTTSILLYYILSNISEEYLEEKRNCCPKHGMERCQCELNSPISNWFWKFSMVVYLNKGEIRNRSPDQVSVYDINKIQYQLYIVENSHEGYLKFWVLCSLLNLYKTKTENKIWRHVCGSSSLWPPIVSLILRL